MAGIEQYLQELGEQKVQEELKIVVAENPTVDLLCDKLKEWLQKLEPLRTVSIPRNYSYFRKLFRGLTYSPQDIRGLSLKLGEFEKYEFFCVSGLFFSYLINKSKDKDFDMMLPKLDKVLEYLGYNNEKNLTIFGDYCARVGQGMKKGKIIVKGHTSHSTGIGMRGGKIIVEGSTGSHTGEDSTGGKIYINGASREDIQATLSTFSKARIYRKGRLVWPE